MKICFVNPPFKPEYGQFSRESRSPCIGHSGVLYYPLWLIYAAAVVQKDGFEVVFIDACAKRTNREQTVRQILETANDARLFVFDTSTPSIDSDVAFASEIKARFPSAFILLVGTHPSATADETLALSSAVDGVARREFDYIVRDLARALLDGAPLDKVRGLSFRKDGTIVHNADAGYISDLDEIPYAAKFIKEHLCVTDYVFPAARFPSIQIFTGRGCPARCNFCVYPQTLHGHQYRFRSPENVIGEIEYITRNFPDVKELVIEDDTFTANTRRVTQICHQMIDRGLHRKICWLCNARVNLDYETMALMKKAGCHLIIPGIESVDQTILNNIRKGTTVAQIESFMSNAKKAGLMVHACYMVGNPGETHATMEKTLAAAMRFKTDTAQFFPLIPYPGTEAYAWARGNGHITGGYDAYCREDGTLNCIVNTAELRDKELVDFCAHARRKYYLRAWYIGHRLIRGLRDFEDLKRSLKAFSKLKRTLFATEARRGMMRL